jgi:hypothetical protein
LLFKANLFSLKKALILRFTLFLFTAFPTFLLTTIPTDNCSPEDNGVLKDEVLTDNVSSVFFLTEVRRIYLQNENNQRKRFDILFWR